MNRIQKLKEQKYKNYFELDDKQELLYKGRPFPLQENMEEWHRLQSMKIAVLDDILEYEK